MAQEAIHPLAICDITKVALGRGRDTLSLYSIENWFTFFCNRNRFRSYSLKAIRRSSIKRRLIEKEWPLYPPLSFPSPPPPPPFVLMQPSALRLERAISPRGDRARAGSIIDFRCKWIFQFRWCTKASVVREKQDDRAPVDVREDSSGRSRTRRADRGIVFTAVNCRRSLSLFNFSLYLLLNRSGCRTPASRFFLRSTALRASTCSLTRNHAKLNRCASIIPHFTLPFFFYSPSADFVFLFFFL